MVCFQITAGWLIFWVVGGDEFGHFGCGVDATGDTVLANVRARLLCIFLRVLCAVLPLSVEPQPPCHGGHGLVYEAGPCLLLRAFSILAT